MVLGRTLVPMRNRVLTSALVAVLALGVVAPSFGDAKGVPNDNAAGYWTQDRRDNAIPREFQFEPGAKVGKLVPQAKRGGSSGGTTTTSGTSYWPAKQQGDFVANITGKVFFTMNGSNYVCSGSLIDDGNAGIAVVVTAGHCVWDNSTTGGFATNWTFYPNYDPDSKLSRSAFQAKQLFAPKAFTNQTSFNTTAILNDFAFAVLNSSDLRVNPGTLPALGNFVKGNTAYAFGYPQASPFNGNELVYSFGPISTDPNSGNKTWKLGSTLTGGASGGPWYSGYSNGNSVGTVGSVNSYKYTTDKNSMYGPQFSSSTTELLNAAKQLNCAVSATINCVVLP
jgi:hypothetical protein